MPTESLQDKLLRGVTDDALRMLFRPQEGRHCLSDDFFDIVADRLPTSEHIVDALIEEDPSLALGYPDEMWGSIFMADKREDDCDARRIAAISRLGEKFEAHAMEVVNLNLDGIGPVYIVAEVDAEAGFCLREMRAAVPSGSEGSMPSVKPSGTDEGAL